MLSDLPTEILAKILSVLSLNEILRFSCISWKFYDAAALVYTRRRNEICGRWLQQNSRWSYAEVKLALLSQYGYTVGLWNVRSTVYGGLVTVKFNGYQLIGTQYFPPPYPNVGQQLRPKKIFTIDVNNEGHFVCTCFRGNNGPHQASIKKVESEYFELDCEDSQVHRHPNGQSVEFDLWLCDELGIEKVEETHRTNFLLVSKYKAVSEEVSLKCFRLHLPQRQENVVIQPGLFKGTYSVHGLELILLTYTGENMATITKITGDPNIPAGQTTILADLHSLVDSGDFDSSDEEEEEEKYPGSHPNSSSGTRLQRFILPSYISARDGPVPEFCRFRFCSKGQIAEHGYQNSQFIPGIWVIFDDDTFGHIWLYLAAFAMFKRITEDF